MPSPRKVPSTNLAYGTALDQSMLTTNVISRTSLSIRSASLALSLALIPCRFAHPQTPAPRPAITQSAAPASLQTIQQMIDKGQAAEALVQLSPLAASTPVPPGVYRLQGRAFYAMDRFAEADTALESSFFVEFGCFCKGLRQHVVQSCCHLPLLKFVRNKLRIADYAGRM